MNKLNYTIGHKRGQHLSTAERHDIEVHLRDGWNTYRIAKHLGRPYNTIKNEIQRGAVLVYHGKVKRYKAKIGEDILFFADKLNALPRRILGHHTPEELFEKELNRIYAT